MICSVIYQLVDMGFVSISQGCLDKMSQTGWFKQQKFVVLLLWTLEVQNQGVGYIVFL